MVTGSASVVDVMSTTSRAPSEAASGLASVVSGGTSGGGNSAATSASSERLHNRQFGFEAQSSYSARVELMRMRDKNFHIHEKPVDNDIWKRPPPDFRLQCFEPKPPKRNSRAAMQPWRYGPMPAEIRAEAEARKKAERDKIELPDRIKPKAAKEEDFELSFCVKDPHEMRVDFVTNGMFRPDPFENPKLHDYRQYPAVRSLGLPEFDTSMEPDPFDIRFNSQRLGIIHGLSRGVPPERNIKGPQMAPVLKQPAKWESRLHLPAGPWPTPVAQYSRFRPFWRSPQTVMLDKMESTLASQWAQEKNQVSPPAAKPKFSQRTLVQASHT